MVTPTILSGQFIHLEPLTPEHKEALREIARDESIWTYLPTQDFERWFEKAMNQLPENHRLPFVVRHQKDQKIIGTTSYYNIDLKHKRLHVGYTWYAKDVRGTKVNPECKFLLFQHAFETLAFNRIEFFVDARNLISYKAIKKLGATEEGVLREHMILDNGHARDTVVLSILKSEWPKIKEKLFARLAQ